jgi:hypothetical protein
MFRCRPEATIHQGALHCFGIYRPMLDLSFDQYVSRPHTLLRHITHSLLQKLLYVGE